MKLFDVEPEKVIESGLTCLTCENRERWVCGSKVFQYCAVRKSNRTTNGRLKIKCKDAACLSYKKQID
jgi:hypothetical protein